MNQNYPVVVIGAGPIGLAAAAHLIERNQDVRVLEAGATAGAAMAEWGHIKLFSTWRYNIDAASRRLLETPTDSYAGDWEAPRETRLPSGVDMVAEYLEPLASHPALAGRISYGHRVAKVTRIQPDGRGVDKTSSKAREDSLFLVRTETAEGTEDILARAGHRRVRYLEHPQPGGTFGHRGHRRSRSPRSRLHHLPAARPPGHGCRSIRRQEHPGAGRRAFGGQHADQPGPPAPAAPRHPGPLGPARGGQPGAPLRRRGGRRVAGPRPVWAPALRRFVENGDITILENVSVTALETGDRLSVVLADNRNLAVDLLVSGHGLPPGPVNPLGASFGSGPDRGGPARIGSAHRSRVPQLRHGHRPR